MALTPKQLAWGLSIYPPFLGAGIRVKEIAPDWSRAVVVLRTHLLNMNTNGTAFGGSLQSMTDAFFPLLLMPQLGGGHTVWDSASEVHFKRPGGKRVTGVFEMPRDRVEDIRQRAADGKSLREWFDVDLRNDDGEVVAAVRRQIYVKRRTDGSAGKVAGVASLYGHH